MDDLLAGSILGDYEVREPIGRGGMGVVYHARQLTLDRPVAIKILAPELCSDHEYIDRFLREARAAAHLNHPNIIQIYDAGVCDSIYFFVMEYVDGKNLGQVLKRVGRFMERDALQMVSQTTRGLSFAHRAGMVHRDVKPENLMLTSEGSVKIGDLGLAKWKPNEYDVQLTQANTTMGTPYYISPEQIRGVKNIDSRADIYSLGMTLYHFLAGRPAFSGGTPPEIMAQHLSDPPPNILELNPDVSMPTVELISEMISKKRENRIPDMDSVENRIHEILGDQEEDIIHLETPLPSRSASKPPGFWNTMPHLVGVGLALLAVLLVGLAVWKVNRKPPAIKSPEKRPMAQAPAKPGQAPEKLPSTPANKPTLPHQSAVTVVSLPPIPSTPEKPKPQPPTENPPVAEQAAAKPLFEAPKTKSPSKTPEFPTSPSSPTVAVKPPEPKKVFPPPPPPNPFETVILQGPSDIRDFTITSKPLPTSSTDPHLIGPALKDSVELEVGNLNGQESKALMTSKLFDQDNLDLLSQNIQKCVEATLEITSHTYKMWGEKNPSPFDFLDLEVTRVLKNWNQNLPDPEDLFRALQSKQRGRWGGSHQGDSPTEWLLDCLGETTWIYASKTARLPWSERGANRVGFDYDSDGDYENKALPLADDPMENSTAKITLDSVGKPVRFNILPDLKRLFSDPAEPHKPPKHYGWIIRTVRGSGWVRFFSCLTDKEEGPKILLKFRKEQKNEESPAGNESNRVLESPNSR